MKNNLSKVIIVICILAAAAIIVWQFTHNSQNQPSPASSEQIAPTASSNNEAPSSQLDPNEGYVVIKEWDVRFKVENNLVNFQYAISSHGEAIASFSTSQLAAYGKDCSAVGTKRPLGWLTRTTAQKQEQTSSSGAFVKKIGEYYYQYYTPQGVCSQETQAAGQLQTQILNEQFKPSIITLEAIK